MKFAWSQRKEPLISTLHFQRLVMLKEDKDSEAEKTIPRNVASLQEVQCHCCHWTIDMKRLLRLYSLTCQCET